MTNPRPFDLTDELLQREIAALELKLGALRRERAKLHELANPSPSASSYSVDAAPIIMVPNDAFRGLRTLTAAEAIQSVLQSAERPMSVRELAERIKDLPTQGKPDSESVRAILHRRGSTLGWERVKHGKVFGWRIRGAGQPTQESEGG